MPDVPKCIGGGEIKISEIRIGERFRKDYGDLDVLALSISVHGLLNPIILHQVEVDRFELVEGERRILAHKLLGKHTIQYRLFSELDEETKLRLELELSLRRKSLTFVEEAKACKAILTAARSAILVGKVGRFSGNVKNKDIAMELGMSEPAFSVNIKLAEAMEIHPELANAKNKREALTMLSRNEFTIQDPSVAQAKYKEQYLVDTALNLAVSLPTRSVDLFIMHPAKLDTELVKVSIEKLKLGGSILAFGEFPVLEELRSILNEHNMYVTASPYIWSIKGEDTYLPFLWAGKARENPLRGIPAHLSYARSKFALSINAKPYNLLQALIRATTEDGQFIVSYDCEDLDTIKVCMDLGRNVRANTMDRVLRDRLLMNLELVGNKGE